MNFEKIEKDNYTIIKSKVEKLDTNHAPELKSEFLLLSKMGIYNVIFDLAETRYCDSSGLSAILVGNRLTKEGKGVFVVSSLQSHVMSLIRISQLDAVLNITPTLSEGEDFIMMEILGKSINSDRD